LPKRGKQEKPREGATEQEEGETVLSNTLDPRLRVKRAFFQKRENEGGRVMDIRRTWMNKPSFPELPAKISTEKGLFKKPRGNSEGEIMQKTGPSRERNYPILVKNLQKNNHREEGQEDG